MSTRAHKLLTGTDLHEPKGVATAPAGQVYVSDGAGSGVWTVINTTVSFTTGDCKWTLKTTPDTGWIIWTDSFIGSATSGAGYPGAQFQPLYELLWNNMSNTDAPVIGGRGGSAAADFAANKKITMPPLHGRALGVAGASLFTARRLGEVIGEETHTLTAAEIPTIASANLSGIAVSVTSTTPNTATGVIQSANVTGGSDRAFTSTGINTTIVSAGTLGSGTVIVTSSNTGGTAHNIMQPTGFINLMVKL